MKKQINSRWVIEKGCWSEDLQTFTDRTTEEFERQIEMEIFQDLRSNTVLHFIGGPTGHEAYYLDGLLPFNEKQGEFCICAGTINSWPACYVQWADVKKFYEEYIEHNKLASDIKEGISEILGEALSGNKKTYETADGVIRWTLVLKDMHNLVDDKLLSAEAGLKTKKEV